MPFRIDMSALILAALQKEPLHGYEIVRRIRETGGAGKLSEGQIYPYLHDLENRGLLVGEWQTDTGAAARKVYRLTPKGHGELERQKSLWNKFASGVGSLLATGLVKMEETNG